MRAWQLAPGFLPGESPWTEKPGGLQSVGSQRVRHDLVTKHIAHIDLNNDQNDQCAIKKGAGLLKFSKMSLAFQDACQCRRCRFDPWVRKIPWKRKWQPTPVFLPGKFHGQTSLVGYSPWGRSQRVRHDWAHIHTFQEEVQAFLLYLSPFWFCVVFSSYFLLFSTTPHNNNVHQNKNSNASRNTWRKRHNQRLFLEFSSSLITFSHTSLVAQMVKASAYNAEDPGSIPGLGRSPGEGNGNPLQYSCLENPMDGGAW